MKNIVQMFAVLVLKETMEDTGDRNSLPLLFSSPSSHFFAISLAQTQQGHNAASWHLPQWARWAPHRAGAERWWCGCAPAAQPGAAVCTRSAGTRKGKDCGGHSKLAASKEWVKRRRKTHLRFGIDFCRMLQKEVNNLYVSVVAANVQGSISHLEWT